MFLKSLAIKNFRAISNIEVELTRGVNVIVGPNAIGKTTILEAVRLAKSLLATRSANEAQQTLISLGAASPHTPQTLIAEGVAQDSKKSVEIRCGFQMQPEEVVALKSAKQQIVTNIVRSRLGTEGSAASISAFLSSPKGRDAIAGAENEVDEGLKRLESSQAICRLDLIIDFQAGRIVSPDPIGAALLAYMDQSLSPDQTKFSYFPADRALPRGEVPVQLGAQDAQQQLEAHNSQPQLKYNRLKNTIFGTIIASEDGRKILENEFEKIFSGILKGRELVGAGLSRHGLLSIRIRDKESGRIFDIDGLSSGEKGLVLTFLLIGRTVADHGIVLLDEPELHLNPAVCKDLLSFMVDSYVIPKNLQLIVCSHSPEILAGAFERDECALFHLVTGDLLTPVRQSDKEEIAEALRRLGTSESEGLLYKATIFVEGQHDVEILEAGFGALLRSYKLKDLGGRKEVEKQIRLLQDAEKSGEHLAHRYFIFDRDESPSGLQNTSFVKILQWERRCLENYLIDIDALTDLLKDKDITSAPVRNSGEVTAKLKEFAMGHMKDSVIKSVYESYEFKRINWRSDEVVGRGYQEVAGVLSGNIDAVTSHLNSIDLERFKAEFLEKCQEREEEVHSDWDARWRELCDGKRLFTELQRQWPLKISLLSFKKRLLFQMGGQHPSENWRSIESLLKGLLN